MSQPLIAGVELGGTKVVCILASGPDDVRDEARIPTTTPMQTLAAVQACLHGWRNAHQFDAVGVGSFGPLQLDEMSSEYGRIGMTPKPGWSGADLLAPLRAFGTPVGLDTDVNGAAIAEGLWGAARGLASWAYVTVGTGVGVGSIVGGRPVRGLGHSEAGHLRVPRLAGHDNFAGCCLFHQDCVEGLASGPAIAARAGAPAETVSPRSDTWDEPVHALAMLCHNLAMTSVPQRILIGGGVGAGQPHLLPRIRKALRDSLGDYAHGAHAAAGMDDYLLAPALGGRAGPLGAIAIGRQVLGADRG